MSNTHITVEKNGIQDEMNITVWNAIGADANKDGWKKVATAPVEVIEMKKKVAETKETVIDPIGEQKEEEPVAVKEKAKSTKKK